MNLGWLVRGYLGNACCGAGEKRGRKGEKEGEEEVCIVNISFFFYSLLVTILTFFLLLV